MEKRMTYSEFVKKLTDDLSVYYKSTHEVKLIKADKECLQDVIEIMSIEAPKDIKNFKSAGTTCYPKEIYEDLYLKGKPYKDVVSKIISGSENSLDNVVPNAIKTVNEIVSDFEKMKERMFVRLLPFKEGQTDLSEFIYETFGDIAFVVYALIGSGKLDPKKTMMGSMKITNSMIKKSGITASECFEHAMQNSITLFPPQIYPLTLNQNSISKNPIDNNFMNPISNFKFIRSEFGRYMITNTSYMNGATAIFYPGAATTLGKIFKSDFYILPTCIHEVLVEPVTNTTEKKAKDSIREFHRDLGREALSELVYVYRLKTDKIEILD
jgi:hypothetical protein